MSALPPKADIAERNCHVRFVPIAEVAGFFDIFTMSKRQAGP